MQPAVISHRCPFCPKSCRSVSVCVSSALILVMSSAVVSLLADESAIHLLLLLLLFVRFRTPKFQQLNWFCPSAGSFQQERFHLDCTAATHTHTLAYTLLSLKKANAHSRVRQRHKTRGDWLKIYMVTHTHTHTTFFFIAAVGYDCSSCGRRGGTLTLTYTHINTQYPLAYIGTISLLFIAHSYSCIIYILCTHSQRQTHTSSFFTCLMMLNVAASSRISSLSSVRPGSVGAVIILTVC